MIENVELGKYYDILRKEEITIDILGKKKFEKMDLITFFSRNEPQ